MRSDPYITEEMPLDQGSVDLLRQVVIKFQHHEVGAREGDPTRDDIVDQWSHAPVPICKLLPIIAAGLRDGLRLESITVQNVDHDTGSGGVDFYRCIWSDPRRNDLRDRDGHPLVWTPRIQGAPCDILTGTGIDHALCGRPASYESNGYAVCDACAFALLG